MNTTDCFFQFSFIFLLFYYFDLSSLFWFFSLIVSFRFSLHTMCMSCPVVPLLCLLHTCTWYVLRGDVVSLWRSFVTTELASLLLGLKNRHGHWLCWMSTGRKNTYSSYASLPAVSQFPCPTSFHLSYKSYPSSSACSIPGSSAAFLRLLPSSPLAAWRPLSASVCR